MAQISEGRSNIVVSNPAKPLLKEIVIALQAYGQAHRFIAQHRLWKWILVPGIIYMILFMVSMYFFWNTASDAVHYLNTVTGLRSWLDRMNSGWLSFLVSFAELVLTLLMLLFYFSLFKYLWLLIGSPVFAYLSEKTESILDNRDFPFSAAQLFRDMARGIRLALRNALWQSVYIISTMLLSLVPLAGWAAPLLAMFIECYYYGFSMLDYSFERHKMAPQQSIAFISQHKGLAIGNGFVFYLMHLVPVLGWVLAPSYAVVAATISLYHQKEKW